MNRIDYDRLADFCTPSHPAYLYAIPCGFPEPSGAEPIDFEPTRRWRERDEAGRRAEALEFLPYDEPLRDQFDEAEIWTPARIDAERDRLDAAENAAPTGDTSGVGLVAVLLVLAGLAAVLVAVTTVI